MLTFPSGPKAAFAPPPPAQPFSDIPTPPETAPPRPGGEEREDHLASDAEGDLFSPAAARTRLAHSMLEPIRQGGAGLLEEAAAFTRLTKEFGWRQEEIAQALGRSRAAVANRARLLDLSPEAQTALEAGQISVGHAKLLLSVKDPHLQSTLAQTAGERRLTVRALERLIQSHCPRPTRHQQRHPEAARAETIGQHLSTHLGAPIRVIHDESEGRLEIEYQGIDDLHRIANLLGLSV